MLFFSKQSTATVVLLHMRNSAPTPRHKVTVKSILRGSHTRRVPAEQESRWATDNGMATGVRTGARNLRRCMEVLQ
jgi:hypothetical protein